MAFALDPFVAFDIFVSRRLRPGDTVDEYLGDLRDRERLIEENTGLVTQLRFRVRTSWSG